MRWTLRKLPALSPSMAMPGAGDDAGPSTVNQFVFTATALCVLMLAPFLVFLAGHQYSVLAPEIALCFGVAAGVSLLVASIARHPVLRVLAIAVAAGFAADAQFDQLNVRETTAVTGLATVVGWFLRDHLAKIVVLAGATFLISTVVLGSASAPEELTLVGGNDERPFVLHVLLDEHTGAPGLPRGARSDAFLQRQQLFFERHGFKRFPNAYSEYFWTRYSVSQMLNLSSGRYTPGLFRASDDARRFELVENRLFSRVASRKYAINVVQTTYLDVCADARTVAHCETYDFAGIRELQYSRLAWLDRFYAVGTAYARRTFLYNRILRLGRFLRKNADQQWLPSWAARRMRDLPRFLVISPSEHYAGIATRVHTERMISALSHARRGQYLFAHLMAPHYPYIFRPDCSIRPPSEWVVRLDSEAPRPTRNTPEGREERYLQYLDQLDCVYKDLDRLIEAIPKDLQRDAVIMLHGDHGSRITIIDPDADQKRVLTATDYRDAYSTLLAIRSPSVSVGEDTRPVAVSCVLAAMVESEFSSTSPSPSCNPRHTVFKVLPERRVVADTPVAATYAP